MSRSQWGISVGVGPVRVNGPAPTGGIKLGVLIGLLLVGFMLGLSRCEKYTSPPKPAPTPTAVTSSS